MKNLQCKDGRKRLKKRLNERCMRELICESICETYNTNMTSA